MVNNADWLDGLPYIPCCANRRHSSGEPHAEQDSVKLSLEREQPLSIPRIQLNDLQAPPPPHHPPAALIRFSRVARVNDWRAADGRIGQWETSSAGRARAAGRWCALIGLTTPLIAEGVGRPRWARRRRAGLDQRERLDSLRLLAVLGQNEDGRCRPGQRILHRAAARRDRAYRACRARDQRGQEDPRDQRRRRCATSRAAAEAGDETPARLRAWRASADELR